MNETTVTLLGNAATGVVYRETAAGIAMARFRLAVTVRRWERARERWTEAYTSFYTVWAWRSLAANVAASVAIGEPLVVQGKLRVREEEVMEQGPGASRAGPRRLSADIEAIAVGHDLSYGTSAFRRVAKAKPGLTRGQGAAAAPG
ncbi:single-stranded DNA-binding protein, partial [Streptomyces sp. H27-D2]|uniref:single-stranded DNA-binding protein n=1 Tax=Streptomyces sp. H27-D2 TaxID=3046304 RepID=UPI002DBDFFF7